MLVIQSKKHKLKTQISEIITRKLVKLKTKITTDHDHDKYITKQVFNKLTSETFTARRKQANLASKNDIANFAINHF